jgi:long-chain acyl-CoA synthetase
LGAALTQVVGLIPRQSTALVLLDDSVEFLVADLALAQNSIVSFTLASPSLLISALEKHSHTTIIVHESLLENTLEHVMELRQMNHHSIIVVGDEKGSCLLHSQKSGVRILRWEDLEEKGKSLNKSDVIPPSMFIFYLFLCNCP